MALELRPSCEHCNTALPPSSPDARICSFECTFCATCVDHVLGNVCPNCGGNFQPRPIRPSKPWRGQAHLGARPASTTVIHRPVDPAAHGELVSRVGALPPDQR